MSDSQRFPVAAHALAYLAHKGAYGPAQAAPSAVLAASVPTNPVVIRRVTAMLAKAGLIATRSGASGGSWLLRKPEDIRLDEVLRAVNGCAHLGSPPAGAKGCPVGEHIPRHAPPARQRQQQPEQRQRHGMQARSRLQTGQHTPHHLPVSQRFTTGQVIGLALCGRCRSRRQRSHRQIVHMYRLPQARGGAGQGKAPIPAGQPRNARQGGIAGCTVDQRGPQHGGSRTTGLRAGKQPRFGLTQAAGHIALLRIA